MQIVNTKTVGLKLRCKHKRTMSWCHRFILAFDRNSIFGDFSGWFWRAKIWSGKLRKITETPATKVKRISWVFVWKTKRSICPVLQMYSKHQEHVFQCRIQQHIIHSFIFFLMKEWVKFSFQLRTCTTPFKFILMNTQMSKRKSRVIC